MFTTSLALLLRVLSNPVGNVFQKKLTVRQNHPLLINFLTFFLLGILCLIPASMADWSVCQPEAWMYGLIAGVFGIPGVLVIVVAHFI